MSSLLLYSDERQVFCASDTLGVSIDRTPRRFCSKMLFLPHARTIIAGQGGISNFISDWVYHIGSCMSVNDVVDLDRQAQENLTALFSRYKNMEELVEREFNTQNLIHAGFSAKDGLIHVFRYRSETGFRSQELQYGTMIYPECPLSDEEYDLSKPQNIMRIMERQRERQIAKWGRPGIGGEIIAMHLNKAGCGTFRVGVFPDYEQDRQLMVHRINAIAK